MNLPFTKQAPKFTKRAFIPQPDITAYELAQIFASVYSNLPPMGGVNFIDEVWQSLPDGIKRHFKEMPNDYIS